METIAAVFSILYAVFAAKELVICWLFGALGAFFYLLIFFDAGLLGQSSLQLLYIGMSFYGAFVWLRGGDYSRALKVSRLAIRERLGCALLVALCGMYILISGRAADQEKLVQNADIIISCLSVFATWLTCRKILESWILWILLDASAAVMFYFQELYITQALFLGYTVVSIYGYSNWCANSGITREVQGLEPV